MTGLVLIALLCAAGLSAATPPPTGGPSGPSVPSGPSIPPTTYPPTIEVSYVHPTAGRIQIGYGSVVNVDYGTQLSALAFEITVSDPDANPVSLTTGITNIGSTGIVLTEWNSASAGVPYTLAPTSGVFNSSGGQTYTFGMSASDSFTLVDFDFSVVQSAAPANAAPSLTLFDNRGAASVQVTDGVTLQVDHNFRLADFFFQLSVDDADGDPVSLGAAITNLGATGIQQAEWESAVASTPYTLYPTAGVFNTSAGVTHQITLTAHDGTDQTSMTFYIRQSAQPDAPGPSGLVSGSGGGGACVATTGSLVWPVLLMLLGLGVVAWRYKKAA
ncbi:MAG: hypothetical protein KDB29_12110 [Planctomycetes bacterium]|nr:hypothetical protein [Planctomycetota bacterium]